MPVREFIVAGGLIKNALLMQIYADVLNMPLTVVSSEQAPALGSAIHAAVAAGAYPDVAAAAAIMGRAEKDVYQPIKENAAAYDQLFAEYITLHDYFGRGANDVMHRLRGLRRAALDRSTATRSTAEELQHEHHRRHQRRHRQAAARGCRTSRRAAPVRARGLDRR